MGNIFAFVSIAFTLLTTATYADITDTEVPRFKKVMIVIFENTDYADAVKQPFFAKLATQGANLTKFFAETHPSQPNYIALTSGSLHGVKGNENVTLEVKNIGDLLEAKKNTWKVYAEGLPSECFLGATDKKYARKHEPMISYKSIQKDPKRCAKIVNADELQKDVEAGTLPDFSLFIPDLDNDGHDTGVKFADKWYRSLFGPLLKNPKFAKDMLLVTTFDEGSNFGTNQVYTSLYGDLVEAGSESNLAYDHFSLLRTLEAGFGLDNLGQEDKGAATISGVWKK